MTDLFTPRPSNFVAMNEEEQGALDRYIARGLWAPFNTTAQLEPGEILQGILISSSRLIKSHKWRVITKSTRAECSAASPRTAWVFPYFYRMEAAD